MPEDALRAVAEAVEFTVPYQAQLPFQLDHVPAGMEPQEAAGGTTASTPDWMTRHGARWPR